MCQPDSWARDSMLCFSCNQAGGWGCWDGAAAAPVRGLELQQRWLVAAAAEVLAERLAVIRSLRPVARSGLMWMDVVQACRLYRVSLVLVQATQAGC